MDLTREQLAQSLERIAMGMDDRGLADSSWAVRKASAALRAEAEKEEPGGYSGHEDLLGPSLLGWIADQAKAGFGIGFTAQQTREVAAALRAGEEFKTLLELECGLTKALRAKLAALEAEKAKGWGCKMSPETVKYFGYNEGYYRAEANLFEALHDTEKVKQRREMADEQVRRLRDADVKV